MNDRRHLGRQWLGPRRHLACSLCGCKATEAAGCKAIQPFTVQDSRLTQCFSLQKMLAKRLSRRPRSRVRGLTRQLLLVCWDLGERDRELYSGSTIALLQAHSGIRPKT
jgi:hypothetical protein